MAIATTRLMGMHAESEILQRMGTRFESSIRAVAAWPVRSASKRSTMTYRSPVANERCSRPCESAETDTLIIADGFSCQEQIRQQASRHAYHLAEVLEMALGDQVPADRLFRTTRNGSSWRPIAIGAAAVAIGAFTYWGIRRLRET